MDSAMNQYQGEVAVWTQYNFPDDNPVVVTIGLAEEAGEVCRAVLKDHQKIRGTHEEWVQEVAKELGDVLIKCFQVATAYDLNLEECLAARWEVVQKRDLIANPQGHGLPDDAV